MPELQHQSAVQPLFPASSRGGSTQALAADVAAALDAPHGAVARIRAALERAVSDPDLLDAEQREPGASCYARHVIYSDPRGRFTILAIVWGASQFSLPHAHDTWCAYAVYDGPLQETVYAIDRHASKAKAICTKVRNPGYSCFAGAGLDQIHRLGNAGTRPAISIHVYGVERDRVGTHVNRIMEIDDEKGSAA